MSESDVRNRKKIDRVISDEASTANRSQVTPRFGALPTFPYQRVWTRVVLVVCASVVVYFSSSKGKETVFASQRDVFQKRGLNIPCSDSYQFELSKFKGCTPKVCGRLVSDAIITSEEADTLINLAKTGIALGGSDGGASILDLHSGALSHGQNFVNFFKLPEATNILKPEDYITYNMVKNKIQDAIAEHFGIQAKYLHLTYPTFFSRLTSIPPKTVHDEYWHKHVDKETYEAFHYTSLLYLNDFKKDFTGGRFAFVNADNTTAIIEPRKGRVSMFTSGAENPHYVERVATGVRYAVTVSFTCDPTKAIADIRPPA
ncbi:hypothetical protein RUM43_006815 [Polyplax serrata]|uniref:Prolyl 4-hydroxylase alpha subunit domain-containing protein n=1 Tax=Polyplax serrata TaxID=468196 RepID=A0AAN8Q5D1_POLSC